MTTRCKVLPDFGSCRSHALMLPTQAKVWREVTMKGAQAGKLLCPIRMPGQGQQPDVWLLVTGVVERCVGKPNGPDWVSGIEIV